MNGALQKGITKLVLGALLAAAGVWMLFRYGPPDPMDGTARQLLIAGFGGLLIASGLQGIRMGGRDLRRLYQPEVIAALEAKEADRERARRHASVRLYHVVFGWLLSWLFTGTFIGYLTDNSAVPGERTLPLTLLMAAFTLTAIGYAIWVTATWQRRQRNPQPTPKEPEDGASPSTGPKSGPVRC